MKSTALVLIALSMLATAATAGPTAWVTAKIQGSTLTFESRVGGSTRGIESFENAAKTVL